jgi:hypothetical protein
MKSSEHRWDVTRRGIVPMDVMATVAAVSMFGQLINVALAQVRMSAKDSQHYSEVLKMDVAMKGYREKFGDYPPDGTDQKAIRRHLQSAFIGRRQGVAEPPKDLDPARSLVFWLSGICTDPTDPFKPPKDEGKKAIGDTRRRVSDRYVFFEFNGQRLSKNGLYYPPDSKVGEDPPYVYFHHATYDKASYRHKHGLLKPYEYPPTKDQHVVGEREYCNPDSFQIISPGLDHKLGTGGVLSVEAVGARRSISVDDEDNIVNFDNRKVKDIRRKQ